jgi:hypothetical protein
LTEHVRKNDVLVVLADLFQQLHVFFPGGKLPVVFRLQLRDLGGIEIDDRSGHDGQQSLAQVCFQKVRGVAIEKQRRGTENEQRGRSSGSTEQQQRPQRLTFENGQETHGPRRIAGSIPQLAIRE